METNDCPSNWEKTSKHIFRILNDLYDHKIDQIQASRDIERVAHEINNAEFYNYVINSISEVDGFPDSYKKLMAMLNSGFSLEDIIKKINAR